MAEETDSRNARFPACAKRHIATLEALWPSFFGFAFIRAYYDVLSLQCSQLSQGTAWLGQDLVVVGMVPAFLVCVVCARWLLPLTRHKAAFVLAGLAMAASSLLLFLAQVGIGAGGVTLVASALIGGFGVGLAILLWAETQGCCAPLPLVLYVAGAFFMGSLLGWVVEGLDPARCLVANLALSIAGLKSLSATLSRISHDMQPHGFDANLRFPWKLVIALGIFEFVLGVRQGAGYLSFESFTAGVLVASALLFLASLFLSSRFDLTYVYRTPFLLMACGLLATLASLSSSNGAADVMVSTGYALMFLILTVLLCDIARRCGISAALLCSIEELVMLTCLPGHAVGAALSAGLLPLGPNDPVTLALLIALILVASVALMAEREYERWGFSLFGMEELAQATRDAQRGAREDRCRTLAKERGLSPRELEVLLLMVDDASAQRIEQELCIASGTLKSHTRRIYRKCGVHSKEQLMGLIDDSKG